MNRPRGLCWSCYYAPGVRELYPSTSKYAKRGVPNFYGKAKACRPTKHPPGSYGKYKTLKRRAANGQELFHKNDAKDYTDFAGELLAAFTEAQKKRREGYGTKTIWPKAEETEGGIHREAEPLDEEELDDLRESLESGNQEEE